MGHRVGGQPAKAARRAGDDDDLSGHRLAPGVVC
jgi:hypothetical protein